MTVLSPSSCSITCKQIGFQIRALVSSHYVYSTNSGLSAAAAAAAALSVWSVTSSLPIQFLLVSAMFLNVAATTVGYCCEHEKEPHWTRTCHTTVKH